MHMLENIEVLCHSSIRITRNKVMYIDPYNVDKNYNDADVIFITHDHFDHFSEEDIKKVMKDNTVIVMPKGMYEKAIKLGFLDDTIIEVEPNQRNEEQGIAYETVPAYNVNKQFHPKGNGWVGYILTIDGVRYYIAGDTDITEENKQVQCDVAFVPVGGTYTMTAQEAAELVNIIKPSVAVPIHYGSVVGSEQDAENFISNLGEEIQGIILMN